MHRASGRTPTRSRAHGRASAVEQRAAHDGRGGVRAGGHGVGDRRHAATDITGDEHTGHVRLTQRVGGDGIGRDGVGGASVSP